MSTVISVENLSKNYRLGQIGTGTFSRDLEVWWAKMRGKPNPLLRIGDKDHGNRDDEELWALKDVSFRVQQGEVLGIIGRNGAGKSTLLKILSRVTAPTSGRVKVKGRIASLLEVGTGFHPELTGRENIYLNGAILGMSRKEIERKFDEIVDFAEVEKFIDTPVKRYSSGMYVRLAFAVAAHLDPEILVVDEVLAVGDAEFQKKCLGKMGEVAKEGRTVLFVSHNMAAVKQLCSQGILLNFGVIREMGPVDEVINQYLDIFNRTNNVNLLERADRFGSSIFRFTKIQLKNSTGKVVNHIASDEPVEFSIQYTSPETKPLRNVSISIRIEDELGQYVFTLATEFTGNDFPELPSSGVIVCRVPAIQLVAGEYMVFLWCAINGETSDMIENATRFYVDQSDVYNSGKYPVKHKHGIFIVPHSWQQINPFTLDQ
ncbi:MAG: ABC transporter ATP-binding protein [Chloroflexi bacterium]|nr:ABC transporter ATP-binding protein [Chloroflexota bacterium]